MPNSDDDLLRQIYRFRPLDISTDGTTAAYNYLHMNDFSAWAALLDAWNEGKLAAHIICAPFTTMSIDNLIHSPATGWGSPATALASIRLGINSELPHPSSAHFAAIEAARPKIMGNEATYVVIDEHGFDELDFDPDPPQTA